MSLGHMVSEAPVISDIRREPRFAVVPVQVLVFVLAIAGWHVVSSSSSNVEAFVSSPRDVAEMLWHWFFGPDYVWTDMYATLRVAFIGLLIGCAVAVALAFVLAQVTVVSRFLAPFIAAANVLPKVALIPLFILWFGVGDLSKIVFVSVGVYFIVFYNVFTSVTQAAREQRDHLRILGASRWWVIRELLLPTAWGSLISSTRLAVAFALLGAVLSEMMAANSGLGFRLAYGLATIAPDRVVSAVLIVAVVGATVDTVLSVFDRRLAAWRSA